MASRQVSPGEKPKPGRPPAKTPEARERQLVGLATDLAEKQLRDGTASAQVTTHYLKLGSSREHLEQELLQETIALQKAKRENMASAAKIEDLYGLAIDAMRKYTGNAAPSDSDDYED